MKVILLENVKNVGNKGDIVEVKDGYGRNFLIKTGKGIIGNKENIAMAEQNKADEANKVETERLAAVELAKKLIKQKLPLPNGPEKMASCLDRLPVKILPKRWKSKRTSRLINVRLNWRCHCEMWAALRLKLKPTRVSWEN